MKIFSHSISNTRETHGETHGDGPKHTGTVHLCCSWYNGTHEFTNLTWTQGRRLSGITEGSDTYSYEYDMAGVRAVKLAGNTRGRSFRVAKTDEMNTKGPSL